MPPGEWKMPPSEPRPDARWGAGDAPGRRALEPALGTAAPGAPTGLAKTPPSLALVPGSGRCELAKPTSAKWVAAHDRAIAARIWLPALAKGSNPYVFLICRRGFAS